MLRIAICCGGGFSSSALASHLEKGVKEAGLEDQVTFIFIPIGSLVARQGEADIAMVCPHSEYHVKRDSPKYTIPVTVIPPRLYGLMPANAFVEDAMDLYELWEQEHHNPCYFKDEPFPLRVTRTTSHKRHLAGEKTDFTKFK